MPSLNARHTKDVTKTGPGSDWNLIFRNLSNCLKNETQLLDENLPLKLHFFTDDYHLFTVFILDIIEGMLWLIRETGNQSEVDENVRNIPWCLFDLRLKLYWLLTCKLLYLLLAQLHQDIWNGFCTVNSWFKSGYHCPTKLLQHSISS